MTVSYMFPSPRWSAVTLLMSICAWVIQAPNSQEVEPSSCYWFTLAPVRSDSPSIRAEWRQTGAEWSRMEPSFLIAMHATSNV